MADISENLSTIESSIHGGDIREAIIQAMEKINDGSTVQRLDGILAKDFLTTEEFEAVAPLLDTIVTDSDKGVKSKAIYDNLLGMISAVDKNINRTTSSHSTVADAISDATTSINGIRDAIIEKGTEVYVNAPLSGYADAIKSIVVEAESENEYEFKSLSATENKTYYASDEQYASDDPDKTTVWRTVNVNVLPNVIDKTVTHLDSGNEDFDASDEPKSGGKAVEGYKKFTLDISDQFSELNLSGSDLPDNLDDVSELEFKASDGNKLGYSRVKVDISDHIDSLDVTINTGDTLEEDTFIAGDGDGVGGKKLYGYDKVTITIPEQDGPFTVSFYNDENEIELLYQVLNVDKHGFAVYDGPEPQKDGKEFSGWNPQPVDITADTKCYAQYVDRIDTTDDIPSSGKTIDIVSNKIKSDWDIINSVDPDTIPLGSTKTIYVDECTFEYNLGNIVIPASSYEMMLMGKETKGLTWISSTAIPVKVIFDDHFLDEGSWRDNYIGLVSQGDILPGWRDSKLRKNLNSAFKNAITSASSDLAIGQKNINIIEADKLVKEYYYPGLIEMSTKDYIWVIGALDHYTGISVPNVSGSIRRDTISGTYSYTESYEEADPNNPGQYITKYRQATGIGSFQHTTMTHERLDECGLTSSGIILSFSVYGSGWFAGKTNESILEKFRTLNGNSTVYCTVQFCFTTGHL